MAEIVPATDDHVARFYGGVAFTSRWTARVMCKGRLVAGFGGLIEAEPGVWVGFLEVPAHERRPSLYRHVIEVMNDAKAQGATVIKTWCDDSIPRAPEMMIKLGFKPTDEMTGDKVIWQWAS